ncbi:MAG: hypothetical protein AAGG02_09230 [Cyanobacteria bacterium P01_H01_bin.15]
MNQLFGFGGSGFFRTDDKFDGLDAEGNEITPYSADQGDFAKK